MAFTYLAARSYITNTDVVTVTAEGTVILGTKTHFRFIVEQNADLGLNAKLHLVVEPPTGIHSMLMVRITQTAELSIPLAYDRVIVFDADGEHTVFIS
jgi:hypothetical protein